MIDSTAQLNALANVNQASGAKTSPEALRKAAMQFEAILLQQLTASLASGGGEGDEDALFGGDSGTGLAKQMFAEQLATTMAESGGIGLADVITRQFGAAPAAAKTAPAKSGALARALAAVRAERAAPNAEASAPDSPAAAKTSAAKSAPKIYKAGRVEPVSNNPTGASEVAVISTFEDEIRAEGLDESLRPLLLDGRIVNSTRPRIAPNAPVVVLAPAAVTAPATAPNAPAAAATGPVRFRMPAAGRISSDFGTRFHPIDRRVKFHGGIDIAVPVGTPVVAAADGIVKFAGWKGGYGNVVVVAHADGSETLYGHNSKLLVAEGQKVTGGEPISLSGSTGKSTGPHLHFELRRDGELVNPADFLSNVLTKPAER